MLSLFPQLFNYSQMAPFLLRLALAIVLFLTARQTGKTFATIKILSGILLLLGLFTQAAAIIVIALTLSEIIIAKKKQLVIEDKMSKVMVIVIALSLLLLGPGLFSFDLPL